MDARQKAELAHAAPRNHSLRQTLEGIIGRLEALENGGVAEGPAIPDVEDWALKGNAKIVPESKISAKLARDSEVDEKIAAAMAPAEDG